MPPPRQLQSPYHLFLWSPSNRIPCHFCFVDLSETCLGCGTQGPGWRVWYHSDAAGWAALRRPILKPKGSSPLLPVKLNMVFIAKLSGFTDTGFRRLYSSTLSAGDKPSRPRGNVPATEHRGPKSLSAEQMYPGNAAKHKCACAPQKLASLACSQGAHGQECPKRMCQEAQASQISAAP